MALANYTSNISYVDFSQSTNCHPQRCMEKSLKTGWVCLKTQIHWLIISFPIKHVMSTPKAVTNWNSTSSRWQTSEFQWLCWENLGFKAWFLPPNIGVACRSSRKQLLPVYRLYFNPILSHSTWGNFPEASLNYQRTWFRITPKLEITRARNGRWWPVLANQVECILWFDWTPFLFFLQKLHID